MRVGSAELVVVVVVALREEEEERRKGVVKIINWKKVNE
jgi:hypothetical protein